ncbi:unnamed protein product [Auanema sp. JU1783]|nr:unnamed protein product [Auanema sp. JU1783]
MRKIIENTHLLLTFMLLLMMTCLEAKNDESQYNLENNPFLECGENSFEISLNIGDIFDGIIFVHGHLNDPKCHSRSKSQKKVNDSTVRFFFDNCGISNNTILKHNGVLVQTKIIVAHNKDFLTKHDKVFILQCFYKESTRYLQREIKVNMKPAVLQTKMVDMPTCKYEVLDGSPFGPPVYYAKVGQPVYHKWSCESAVNNTYCMRVHSCYAENGNRERVPLLNQQGCALDKYLLTNLEYPDDLLAGREAHVYKYADQDHILFDCQITLTIKSLYAEFCEIPTCPDPPRRKRDQTIGLQQISIERNEKDKIDNQTATYIDENNTELENNICFRHSELVMVISTSCFLVLMAMGLTIHTFY